jgi:hypothetical protein
MPVAAPDRRIEGEVALMAASYDDWIGRARTHIAEGRPIDALACFREAARLGPGAVDPLRGMAESLWRLGKAREAVAAWREAATRNAGDLPSWQALAEAALFIGDDALAREAAGHVRAGAADNKVARFVEACEGLASPDTRAAACAALEAMIASKVHLVRRPHMAGALARALAAVGPNECEGLRRLLAAQAANLPFELVPAIAPRVQPALLRARIDAAGAGDVDALRRVAVALPRGELAQAAADRYSTLCAQCFAPDVGLGWPRRTAGERLRVIVIADTGAAPAEPGDAEDPLVALLAALQDVKGRVDLAVCTFGAGQPMVERLAATTLTATRVAQLPDTPDVNRRARSPRRMPTS